MNHPLLAILNTLWQSAAIAAGVWLVLRLARGTNAERALFDGSGQFVESLAAADHQEDNARIVS